MIINKLLLEAAINGDGYGMPPCFVKQMAERIIELEAQKSLPLVNLFDYEKLCVNRALSNG